jgi:hypothetical protein
MNMKRASMGGWVQEKYVALHRAGREALEAGLGFEKAKEAWLQAYEMDPTRCESLYSIAEWCVDGSSLLRHAYIAHV